MTVLVFVQPGDDLSLQALTLARTLGGPVHAVSVGGPADVAVDVLHVAELDGSYAPAAWAAAVLEAADGAEAIVGPGSDRGNEVLAHVGARLDQPFAANVTGVGGDRVTRQRWGGSLLEEARLDGSPKLLTAAPHMLPAEAPGAPASTRAFTPSNADTSVRVLERVEEQTGGVSLRDAKVVVSGGRGVGSAEGFAIIEELASLLAGAVGCSRVVTSAGTVADLTWKEILDGFSCTECGRCQDACPAHATGKVLNPKLVIMGIRDQVLEQSPLPIAGNGVPEEMIWDCVTCGACVEACPVSIEHVDHILDLRRSRVMVDAAFPAEAEPMLRDVERSANPWGKPQNERAAWAASLGVRVLAPGDPPPEVLYWVGCAASFDERAKTSAESTAKLLEAAGVDFAILGPREACTGDPARRIGNEYVFQAYAEQNVSTLNDAGVTRIVASCPHCFNTLANEYGDFGGSYEVLHHTELLAELVRDGRLSVNTGDQPITYHDSCYLARHNDVRLEPRELVSAVGQPVEMKRSGKQTFCCGAGGAHMWMEERGKPINEERAREATETGAETLAVACPFCTVMLDDGVRAVGSQLRVADVSTLLAEALE